MYFNIGKTFYIIPNICAKSCRSGKRLPETTMLKAEGALSRIQQAVTLFADELKNKMEDCHARKRCSLAMTSACYYFQKFIPRQSYVCE